MIERCLLDTSAVSDVIRPAATRPPKVARLGRQYLRSCGQFTFSEMSCFEILRGLRAKGKVGQIAHFQQFCRHSELLPVTYDVLDQAAHIWANGQRKGITVDDGDLIIAATALVAELPLVTANPKHFAWINGLAVSNWRDG